MCICCCFKCNTEAQAIYLYQFTVCSSYKRKLSVCKRTKRRVIGLALLYSFVIVRYGMYRNSKVWKLFLPFIQSNIIKLMLYGNDQIQYSYSTRVLATIPKPGRIRNTSKKEPRRNSSTVPYRTIHLLVSEE
jgi:hypothetical protein